MGSSKPGNSLKMSFKDTSTRQSSSAALNQRKMLSGKVRSSGWLETNVLAKGPHPTQLWDMERKMA